MAVERRSWLHVSESAERILRFIEDNFESPSQKERRRIRVAQRNFTDERGRVVRVEVFDFDLATIAQLTAYCPWFLSEPTEIPHGIAVPSDYSQVFIFPPKEWEQAYNFRDKPIDPETMKEIFRAGGQWGIARPFDRLQDSLPTDFPEGFVRGRILWQARRDDLLAVIDRGLRDPDLRYEETQKDFLINELLGGLDFYYALLPDPSLKAHFLAMSKAGMMVE